MIALIIIVPLLFFGLIGGVTYFFVKKSTPEGEEKEINSNTIQDFLPIKDIKDGYVILKNNRLRKIIRCSSTNYDLKTEDEQTSIEMIFQQFINSLSFPISIFIQTKVIDNTKRMKILRQDAELAKKSFPELNDYANQYVYAMDNINEVIGNSLEKNKYIIVPFDDEITLETATDDEKSDYIKKELENRCLVILNGLSKLGVRAYTLDDNELIELFYSTTHRKNYIYSENLTEDESLSSMVEGKEDIFKKADYKKNLRSTLTSAMNVYNVNSEKLTKEDIENEATIRNIYQKYNKGE